MPDGRHQHGARAGSRDRRRPSSTTSTWAACTSPARPTSSPRIWLTIGSDIRKYFSYPRIVGETGGKDFIFAHASADIEALVAAIVRGAFEYQGQKCSAPSRVYVPDSIWPRVKERMLDEIATIKVGDVCDFSNFVNAVIDKDAFDKIAGYIDFAKQDPNMEILCGGTYDDSEGYFIQPTVVRVQGPPLASSCARRSSGRW